MWSMSKGWEKQGRSSSDAQLLYRLGLPFDLGVDPCRLRDQRVLVLATLPRAPPPLFQTVVVVVWCLSLHLLIQCPHCLQRPALALKGGTRNCLVDRPSPCGRSLATLLWVSLLLLQSLLLLLPCSYLRIPTSMEHRALSHDSTINLLLLCSIHCRVSCSCRFPQSVRLQSLVVM